MEATLSSPTPSETDSSALTPSKTGRRIGVALSGLAVAFLVFDGVTKLLKIPPVVQAMAQLGFPDDTARPIGLVLLACVALYVAPRTAVLGALLITGFLGGAIAAQVRVEAALASHVLFPTYVAALVWGGLALRDARLREILTPAARPPRP